MSTENFVRVGKLKLIGDRQKFHGDDYMLRRPQNKLE